MLVDRTLVLLPDDYKGGDQIQRVSPSSMKVSMRIHEQTEPLGSDQEEWRVIPHYSKYWVSNLGRVMSFQKRVPTIIKPYVRSLSPTVQISHRPKIQVSVASAVASAFADRVKGVGSHLCHKDGNYANSQVDNLEWRLEPQIKKGRRTATDEITMDREFKRICLGQVYQGMVQRCYDPNHPSYKHYGGAGIRVHPDWYAGRGPEFRAANKLGKQRFIRWAMTRSAPYNYRPGLELSRIPDDRSDYGPDTCQFETTKQNSRRRDDLHLVTIDGETKCVNAWIEDSRSAVTASAFATRLRKGWDAKKALMTPGLLSDPDRKLEAWGEHRSFRAWARDPRCSVGPITIAQRVERGWTAELAITAPPVKGSPREAFGESKTLVQWSEDRRCQVSYQKLCHRLRNGWSLEAAMTEPDSITVAMKRAA